MAASHTQNPNHFVMLPFMAQGHLIPFLALARLIEQRFRYPTITIVNTPLNILKLQSSLPQDTTIRLAHLPFSSSDHALPPNCENTDSLPPHLFHRLIQASETLQPSFERLLSDICRRDGRPPFCVISDEFMSWSVDSSHKFGAFHTVFNTAGAYGTIIFISIWTKLPHKKTDSEIFSLPDFPETCLHRSQLTDACKNADGTDHWSLLFRKHGHFCRKSDGVLINTVEELEAGALDHLRKMWKRVWAIGPMLSPPPCQASSSGACIDWLNLHPPSSVLYTSFGSQASIHPWQMMELAKGLEESGKPFIWVIRPPIGFDVTSDFRAEWLPEGYEDRVSKQRKQGLLVRKWAPQLEILSHASTGAFLSHCGWNSILESLSHGVPVIGWPMEAEQFYNSKLLEDELGVGLEMARGSRAEIKWVDVAELIGVVMNGESEKGGSMRKKAINIQEVMRAATREEENRKGSSIRALEEFIKTAASCRENLQFTCENDDESELR